MGEQTTRSDPREHTRNIRSRLTELIEHVRGDIRKVDDPRAQALFETTAEVLIGLRRAHEHFEARSEPAWQEDAS